MKRKMLLVGSLLVGLTLFIGGCHYRTSDSYRYRGYSGYSGYSGYGSRHDAYREGWRDGRAHERRRDSVYDRRDYNYPGYRWGRW